MTTTYYLLRSKNSAVGDGSYLANDKEGQSIMTVNRMDAKKFPSLETAEQEATTEGEKFGGFEIEIRTKEE